MAVERITATLYKPTDKGDEMEAIIQNVNTLEIDVQAIDNGNRFKVTIDIFNGGGWPADTVILIVRDWDNVQDIIKVFKAVHLN